MPADEAWPGFAPFAPAPRPPFGSARGGGGESIQTKAAHGADQRDAEPSDERNRARRIEPGESDRTGRLLRALFEQSSPREARVEPGAEAAAPIPQGTGDRRSAEGATEAQMFAIAFACCRDMLFRLSDQFARQAAAGTQSDDASPGHR